MPPEVSSDLDFYTENESEFDIKAAEEQEYFSSDVHEFDFKKAFRAADAETESELDTKKSETKGIVKKRRYDCQICSETFRRKVQLDRHVFKHNGIKTHKCPECQKDYVTTQALKRHIITYHKKERGEKTFKCLVPNCDKSFDSAHNLEKHSKRRHESPVTYKCEICNAEFLRKIKLKYHIVSVHTKEYPFQCEKCKKKFITDNFLKNHKCKTYICDVCVVPFEKWSQLCAHKKASPECSFKYKCKVCDKEFKFPQLLHDHEQVHKEIETRQGFACSVEGCGKFYTMKKNLDAHYRRKHGDLKEAFKCTVEGCGLALSTKQKLTEHIKLIHTNTQIRLKKAGPRNQRKDAGKKKNILKDLTGLDIPNKVEKQILGGEDMEVVLEPDETILEDDDKILDGKMEVVIEPEKF